MQALIAESLENLIKNTVYICKAFMRVELVGLFSQKSPDFL